MHRITAKKWYSWNLNPDIANAKAVGHFMVYSLRNFPRVTRRNTEIHLGKTVVKNPSADTGDARDTVLILGSGRSPGVGNGNPFQYPCLENSMEKGACWVTVHEVAKSWERLACTHIAC